MKIYVLQVMRPESGFRIALNWPKLEKWHWRHRQIFVTLFFSLVKLSFWSEFQVIIVTEVVTISFYKELTRNLKIGNTRLSFAQYLDTEAS